ncbi:MAG TPA: acyltransferase [Caulobacteraceae bacterium]
MKRLASIQYLRAIAVVGVALFHAFQWRGAGFNVGRAGVDLFFVISGVIMWRITAEREGRPAAFLWARLTRVAPLYWLVTLAMAAVAALWPAFLPNVHPGLSHLLLSLAFVPHLDPKGLPFPLLPPGWTLDYEAIFYLVFAAALLAPRRRQAWIVVAALFFIVAAGLILDDPVYILGANPLLWEFAAGIAAAILAEAGVVPARRGAWALIAVGFAGLAVPALLGLFSELARPFIWGLPAAAIVFGAVALERAVASPTWAPLARLGDASYAVYLVHLPVQAVVAHTLGTANSWLFVPAALAASIGAGLACHRWVETPLIAWARSAASRPAEAAIALRSQNRHSA